MTSVITLASLFGAIWFASYSKEKYLVLGLAIVLWAYILITIQLGA